MTDSATIDQGRAARPVGRFARRRLFFCAAIGAVALAGAAGQASAAAETPIFRFDASNYATDGGIIMSGVVRDPAAEDAGTVPVGTLFGTAWSYGANGDGTVFMVSPPDGGASSLKLIHTFTGTNSGSKDGSFPLSDLVADAAGNLFGTTNTGGSHDAICGNAGCGTVFELVAPASPGGTWKEEVIYRFTGGNDGGNPAGALTEDPSGNGVLYGTAPSYGLHGDGVAFMLTPPGVAGNLTAHWMHKVIYAFKGKRDGSAPSSPLTIDSAGNLFGTAPAGGAVVKNDGVVFELTPPAGGVGIWTETTLHSFLGAPTDGAAPVGRLIVTANDTIYGVTSQGGTNRNKAAGTAFALLPPAVTGTTWQEALIHTFGLTEGDGRAPLAGLVPDNAGNLYGTTQGGGGTAICEDGSGGKCGTAYELTPTGDPTVWGETVLWDFGQSVTDGNLPNSDLSFGADGNLYGTTEFGGDNPGYGTVFQLVPP